MKTINIIGRIVVIVAFVAVIVGYREWSSSLAHGELLDFRSRLSIGQNHTQVALDFGLGHYRRLSFGMDRTDSPERWSVGTPLEWGAKNWVMFIEFKDSRVKRVKIRTDDSVDEKPKDAPPDLP